MEGKKLFIFILGIILNMKGFTQPLGFGLYDNVWFESLDNLYHLSETEFDKIKKYYRDEIYFLCLADNYSEIFGNDRKKRNVIGNFVFAVISKSEYVDYDIKTIQIIHGENTYDINELLYLPYPYEEPLKTKFKKDPDYPNYYVSRYLLGYFKFPAKNKDTVTIRVKILVNTKQYEFDYFYKIQKKKGFIYLND